MPLLYPLPPPEEPDPLYATDVHGQILELIQLKETGCPLAQ